MGKYSIVLFALLTTGSLLAAGLVLLPTQAAAQSSGELSIENDTVSVSPYEEKKVNIVYNNPTDSAIGGVEYTVDFNPDVITVVEHTPSGYNNQINNEQGVVNYASSKTIDPGTTDTVVSTITIRAAEGATTGARTDISFSDVRVLTPTAGIVPTEPQTGSVEVERSVEREVRNTVAGQNAPNDVVGFGDLIVAIEAHHSENNRLDGVEVSYNDLIKLNSQYHNT